MTVEVTEEETLSAGRTAVETLTELRAAGMHVAIDDFGTGYAGLDSFRSVPADIVKVDRSFVDEMLRNDEDFELVRSMLDLIYRFGKLAVAEGIETRGAARGARWRWAASTRRASCSLARCRSRTSPPERCCPGPAAAAG